MDLGHWLGFPCFWSPPRGEQPCTHVPQRVFSPSSCQPPMRDSCCLFLTFCGPASVLGRSYVLWSMEWSFSAFLSLPHMRAKFFLLSTCVFVHVCVPCTYLQLDGLGWERVSLLLPQCQRTSAFYHSMTLSMTKCPTCLLGQRAVLSALCPEAFRLCRDPGDSWFIVCLPVA